MLVLLRITYSTRDSTAFKKTVRQKWLHHEMPLCKSKYYGISGIALDWFNNYLTNRTLIVKDKPACCCAVVLIPYSWCESILGGWVKAEWLGRSTQQWVAGLPVMLWGPWFATNTRQYAHNWNLRYLPVHGDMFLRLLHIKMLFCARLRDWWLGYILWNCPQMHITGLFRR